MLTVLKCTLEAIYVVYSCKLINLNTAIKPIQFVYSHIRNDANPSTILIQHALLI